MCNQPYIFILTPGPKVNKAKSHPQQIKVQKGLITKNICNQIIDICTI